MAHDARVLKVRPSEIEARQAVTSFLKEELRCVPEFFHLIHDGETHWAFWIEPDDPTSYLESDLLVQWGGTDWRPEEGSPARQVAQTSLRARKI